MSFVTACAVATFGLFAVLPHDPGLSSLRATRSGDQLLVHVAFANADFHSAVAIDADRSGKIEANELAAASVTLRQLVRERFRLRWDRGQGPVELLTATIAENDDVELTMQGAVPATEVTLAVDFLLTLSRGHRCYAAVIGAGDAIVVDALLRPTARTFVIPAESAPPRESGFGQAWQFFELGIEHILIGFDHLAFLLALLVVGVSWRRVVATITAFTIAHSVTLLGAAMGFVQLPGLLVEATIAASIVVVAVVNLLQRGRHTHRWPLALGFGLVHGFGFAGVLADLEIGGPDMLVPLLTFNLGVEVGQLAFACVVVPILALAARHRRSRCVPTVLSVLVGVAGCWWLLERLLA